MYRDIKFRAWDKERQRMLSIARLNFISEEALLFDLNEKCNYWKELCNVELMQYTGIKDKNRKEICEGDIFVANNGHKYQVIYDDTRFIGVNSVGVCYVDSCYMNGSSRIEVVGNIYENKELLENE